MHGQLGGEGRGGVEGNGEPKREKGREFSGRVLEWEGGKVVFCRCGSPLPTTTQNYQFFQGNIVSSRRNGTLYDCLQMFVPRVAHTVCKSMSEPLW